MASIQLSNASTGLFTTSTGRQLLEKDILPRYLPECRWFGAKARGAAGCRVLDSIPSSATNDGARLACIRVEYREGDPESYLLPMRLLPPGSEAPAGNDAVIARFADGCLLIDAIH